jgi:hypothetical protein
MSIILKCPLRNKVQTYGQDSYGLIMGPAEGTCEHSKKKKHSRAIKY